MTCGCLVANLVANFKPSSTSTAVIAAVKSSWLWPVLAIATRERFAVALLIPKFYGETARVSWYVLGVLMCGYFSGFNVLHVVMLYTSYIVYTINCDAAILLRATKVISDYTPTQFNTRMRVEKITSIIDNYV
jgi:hypothetical protein